MFSIRLPLKYEKAKKRCTRVKFYVYTYITKEGCNVINEKAREILIEGRKDIHQELE